MSPSDFIRYRHDIAISKALLGSNTLFYETVIACDAVYSPKMMTHIIKRIFENADKSLSVTEKKNAVNVYMSTYKEWVRETVALSAQFFNKVSYYFSFKRGLLRRSFLSFSSRVSF